MASGRSLELAAIKAPPAQRLCVCGKSYESHLTKEGILRKNLSYEKHRPAGARGAILPTTLRKN